MLSDQKINSIFENSYACIFNLLYLYAMTAFWEFIDRYTSISEESKEAWSLLLKTSEVAKGTHFLEQGAIPKDIAYVKKGMLSYYYLNEKGEKIIKRFFTENSLVASTNALLKQEPGFFSIEALEDTDLISYPFNDFKELTTKHNDIANFYITYLERH